MPNERWIIPITAVLFLVFFGVGIFVGQSRQPAQVPATIIIKLDSIEQTRVEHRATIDSLTAVAQRLEGAAQQSAAAARASQESAIRLGHRADSLATVAQSASDWREAYEARTIQVSELLETVRLKDITIDTLERGLQIQRERADKLEMRNVALEDFNRQLAKQLTQPRECRIIGPIPCPSRELSFALGLGLGSL